jgi:hypothetical protein
VRPRKLEPAPDPLPACPVRSNPQKNRHPTRRSRRRPDHGSRRWTTQQRRGPTAAPSGNLATAQAKARKQPQGPRRSDRAGRANPERRARSPCTAPRRAPRPTVQKWKPGQPRQARARFPARTAQSRRSPRPGVQVAAAVPRTRMPAPVPPPRQLRKRATRNRCFGPAGLLPDRLFRSRLRSALARGLPPAPGVGYSRCSSLRCDRKPSAASSTRSSTFSKPCAPP